MSLQWLAPTLLFAALRPWSVATANARSVVSQISIIANRIDDLTVCTDGAQLNARSS
jgi:hypothetical protein